MHEAGIDNHADRQGVVHREAGGTTLDEVIISKIPDQFVSLASVL